MAARPLHVVVFCGGRGSASILRELLRREQVELTLLINAYDDGLSTGALRRLIPGMLGPSDFRKNLSLLLGLHSREQFALVSILEHRLPPGITLSELDSASRSLARGRVPGGPPFLDLFEGIETDLRRYLGQQLVTFTEYATKSDPRFQLEDCALGNLLFAGAYLSHDHNFHAAVRELTTRMGCEARLLDVTSGENRVLVALKADGQLLSSEAEIVGPQTAVPIASIHLLKEPLSQTEERLIVSSPFAEAKRLLEGLEAPVDLSREASEALARADLIVYGPGTQFSSLLPSYKTRGLRGAIARSPARAKAFVVNLRPDLDTQSLDASEMIDAALSLLGDDDNTGPSITHILVSENDTGGPCPAGTQPPGGRHRGALWVQSRYENEATPGIHNGRKTVETLLGLSRETPLQHRDSLDVYVDLRDRAPAAGLVVQELSELDWGHRFEKVVLTINGAQAPLAGLPPPWEIRGAARDELFSEVHVFREWLSRGTSDYLVTLAGDGEYRLSDVALAVNILESGPFGAVFGSRNQSQRQMKGSLAYAYGQSRGLYWGSWLGAYVFSGLFALRFRFQSSDPFTAFRVFRRSALAGIDLAEVSPLESGTGVSRMLLRAGVEIAEIPVYHRTFKGFTNVSTRLARGLKNAVDSIR